MCASSAFRLMIIAFVALLLAGCGAPQVSQAQATVTVAVTADGASESVTVAAGSKVEQAIQALGLILGQMDKVQPPLYATLSEGASIKVTRVREEFEVTQQDVPFTSQTVRNENLADGKQILIQAGENGLEETTVRHLFEDNVETSKSIVKTVVLKVPLPEILMVGAQTPFAPLPIIGKLVYLAGGNAWIMDGTTANRRPLVTTGDLDGRILVLSPKADWLLFTRKSTKPLAEEINTLWVISITDKEARPINLRISNVIHFAAFVPTAVSTVAYSTVEPRAQAPGWQANNDLYYMKFGAQGSLGKPAKILDANSGGIYGWWGTDFSWSPDGMRIAYSRPDGIGLINLDDKAQVPLLDIVPLQTRADWTLIPGLVWGADGRSVFYVNHAPSSGLVSPEESPFYDLKSFSLANGSEARLVRESGMFAYPSVSSLRTNGNEKSYLVSYLQAIFPEQSETSRYRLIVMDRDGSNRRVLFPPEGSQGLEPQTAVWAPQPISASEGDFLGIVYQDNLWLIDIATGEAHQVTGDGQIVKIDWK